MNSHMKLKLYTGNRPMCKKGFSKKLDYDAHMSTHTARNDLSLHVIFVVVIFSEIPPNSTFRYSCKVATLY